MQTLIKTKQNRKIENPVHSFSETNLAPQLNKNCKLKVKL